MNVVPKCDDSLTSVEIENQPCVNSLCSKKTNIFMRNIAKFSRKVAI